MANPSRQHQLPHLTSLVNLVSVHGIFHHQPAPKQHPGNTQATSNFVSASV
eukprot:CAMPEP_0198108952 /NCGR_PEP_ID=MMETSP1442-20131203/978_1 /TAXON_ID= /ORGANISM="Craspedostauros australis, Strain CCMP3328" /LENGTH=50 /DNA_ID=CAMNT_0043764379 /DNA_START=348 /DNA_END=497 /DNA_ORIENTATION=-